MLKELLQQLQFWGLIGEEHEKKEQHMSCLRLPCKHAASEISIHRGLPINDIPRRGYPPIE